MPVEPGARATANPIRRMGDLVRVACASFSRPDGLDADANTAQPSLGSTVAHGTRRLACQTPITPVCREHSIDQSASIPTTPRQTGVWINSSFSDWCAAGSKTDIFR